MDAKAFSLPTSWSLYERIISSPPFSIHFVAKHDHSSIFTITVLLIILCGITTSAPSAVLYELG